VIDPDCVFCQIVVADDGNVIVASGRTWVAFRPLKPVSTRHVLFVPRRHVVSAVTAPRVAGRVVRAAAEWVRANGPQGNLLTSSGPDATQTVNHLHVHAILRGPTFNEGLSKDWPWEGLR
jgi:histidine triad (HIT) family protein